jgi:hypothetical protein
MLFIGPVLSKLTPLFVLDFRDSLAFLDYGAYLSHFLPKRLATWTGSLILRANRYLQERAIKSATMELEQSAQAFRSTLGAQASSAPTGEASAKSPGDDEAIDAEFAAFKVGILPAAVEAELAIADMADRIPLAGALQVEVVDAVVAAAARAPLLRGQVQRRPAHCRDARAVRRGVRLRHQGRDCNGARRGRCARGHHLCAPR